MTGTARQGATKGVRSLRRAFTEVRSQGGEYDAELTGGRGMTWPYRRKEESGEAPVGAGGYVLFEGVRANAVCG